MTEIRIIRARALAACAAPLAIVGALTGIPAHAQVQASGQPQEVVMPPTPNADRLSEELRVLTQNPQDLRALLSAGELSVRIGDASAALSFFARAEAVAPNDPRITAGRAAALVLQQRPGEALRMFAQAEAAGASVEPYASERGLAYDLIGANVLAQADYRRALARGAEDETTRRLAISLGISGNMREAEELLTPLLHRNDAAAWRARAFIMAANGDVNGAVRIAESMMPANMGGAFAPYFQRIAGMSRTDRAFAVHFGELSSTPQRVADAALAPQLPPSAFAAPVLAAAPSSPSRARTGGRADAENEGRIERNAPLTRYQGERRSQPRETRNRRDRRAETNRASEVVVAAPSPEVAAGGRVASPVPEPASTGTSVSQSTAPVQAQVQSGSAHIPVSPTPVVVSPRPSPAPADNGFQAPPPTVVTVAPQPRPPIQAQPQVQAQPPVQAHASSAPTENPVLAGIMRDITIPASELGVPPMREEAPASVPESVPESVNAPAPAVVPAPVPTPTPTPAPAAARPAPRPRPAAPRPPAEPSRMWVQVGIGADTSAFSFTWRNLVRQAPDAFRGQQPWTTPLRATNRLLVGPFANEREAQAFVNQLARVGVSAYSFRSENGQRVTRLNLR